MKRNIKKAAAFIAAAVMVTGSAMTVHAEPATINGVEFDAVYYAEHNPDVVAVFGNDADVLFQHYIAFGQAEGRMPYETEEEKAADAASVEERIQNAMYALKEAYPEGRKWNNDDYYAWKGGIYSGGYGCAGFAFMLSDAAFGNARARKYYDASAVRAGDIARMDGDSHSVIVLEVQPDSVIVAEGNFNNSVHWGRKISRSQLEKAQYFLTRYEQ